MNEITVVILLRQFVVRHPLNYLQIKPDKNDNFRICLLLINNLSVWEDNPRVLVSGLSSVQTHKLFTISTLIAGYRFTGGQ